MKVFRIIFLAIFVCLFSQLTFSKEIISEPGKSVEIEVEKFTIKTSVFAEESGRNVVIFDSRNRRIYFTMIGILPGFHSSLVLGESNVLIECKPGNVLEILY